MNTKNPTIDNGTTRETATIYGVYRALKAKNHNRTVATEILARRYKKPIVEIRDAILREQATAEGITFEERLERFNRNKSRKIVEYHLDNLGPLTDFTSERTRVNLDAQCDAWHQFLAERPLDPGVEPWMNTEDRHHENFYLELDIAIHRATQQALSNRTALTSQAVQDNLDVSWSTRFYGRSIMDVRHLNLRGEFWTWFNTMEWIR